MEIGLNSVDRDETEIKQDIKKKRKKEELEDLENEVEITQQVLVKQPPLSYDGDSEVPREACLLHLRLIIRDCWEADEGRSKFLALIFLS